jgi:DNA-binding transcriptional ArsR family regulator
MPPRRRSDSRTDTVRLDARNLRGLAHPVRVRMLGLLRTEGPSTATLLGERLGLSSAATSYHLRQLAD